jgi:hypothetical protein
MAGLLGLSKPWGIIWVKLCTNPEFTLGKPEVNITPVEKSNLGYTGGYLYPRVKISGLPLLYSRLYLTQCIPLHNSISHKLWSFAWPMEDFFRTMLGRHNCLRKIKLSVLVSTRKYTGDSGIVFFTLSNDRNIYPYLILLWPIISCFSALVCLHPWARAQLPSTMFTSGSTWHGYIIEPGIG